MVSFLCLRALRFCMGACVGRGTGAGARRTVSGGPRFLNCSGAHGLSAGALFAQGAARVVKVLLTRSFHCEVM